MLFSENTHPLTCRSSADGPSKLEQDGTSLFEQTYKQKQQVTKTHKRTNKTFFNATAMQSVAGLSWAFANLGQRNPMPMLYAASFHPFHTLCSPARLHNRSEFSPLRRPVKEGLWDGRRFYDHGKAFADAEMEFSQAAEETAQKELASVQSRAAQPNAVIERLNANYSRLLFFASNGDQKSMKFRSTTTSCVADVFKARIYDELGRRFRFEQPKAFFMKVKRRNFQWDNSISFFDRRNGRFLAGLESEVVSVLETLGVTSVSFSDTSGLTDPVHVASLSSFRDPQQWITEENQRLAQQQQEQPGRVEETGVTITEPDAIEPAAATDNTEDVEAQEPPPEEAPKKRGRGRRPKQQSTEEPPASAPLAPPIPTTTLTTGAPLRSILREHQLRLIEAAIKGPRSILKCATGGGKTLVMATLCHVYDQGRIIILCRNKNLVVQTADVLASFLGASAVGRVSGDFDETNARVIVSTVQSVKKIAKLIDSIDILIVDEVHQFGSKLSKEVVELFSQTAFRWGLSATPLKAGHEIHNYRLKGLFGPLACDVTTKELTATSLLSSAAIRFVVISKPKKMITAAWEFAERAGIYENEHMHKVVAHIVINQIKAGRVLILVQRLDHGDRLQELIPDSFWISGSCSKVDRMTAFHRLKVSKPDEKVVVILSSIGNTGIDVLPHYLINCTGGGVAEALTIQKIGRGLRTGADKTMLHYIDFMHETNSYLKKHSETRLKTLWHDGHTDIAVDTETEKIIDFEEQQQQKHRLQDHDSFDEVEAEVPMQDADEDPLFDDFE